MEIQRHEVGGSIYEMRFDDQKPVQIFKIKKDGTTGRKIVTYRPVGVAVIKAHKAWLEAQS